jgi:hypothetical protein
LAKERLARLLLSIIDSSITRPPFANDEETVMTEYVLELGFDANMIKIQGSDKYRPLQYGLRFSENGDGDPNTGRWLTTLMPGDRIEVRLFDIAAISKSPASGSAPTSLALQFLEVISGQPAAAAPVAHEKAFGDHWDPRTGVLHFEADQLVSLGDRISYVFGRGGRELPCWSLSYPVGTSTPLVLEVEESCLKLSVVVRTSGQQSFAFDPEWVVDPYGGS